MRRSVLRFGSVGGRVRTVLMAFMTLGLSVWQPAGVACEANDPSASREQYRSAPVSEQNPATPGLARTVMTWPLTFEPEAGKGSSSRAFRSHGPGYSLLLDRGSVTLVLNNSSGAREETMRSPHPIHLDLVGARHPLGVGLDPLAARANYIVGSNPHRWRTEIPLFTSVRYREIYPGVDVVYYGRDGEIEHDFVVAPGGNPARIRFSFDGAEAVRLDDTGALVLAAGSEEIRLLKPVAYQEIAGVRREVAAAFELGPRNRAGFRLGAYDPSASLIIDPVISYSTYLGGPDQFDNGYGMAVTISPAGFVYAMGTSHTLPGTPGAVKTSAVGIEVFVAKFDTRATGAASLVWVTYTGAGRPGGIVVDAEGSVYVSGWGGFPATPGAYDTTPNGGVDVGIAKLNPSGSALIWSTSLGGISDDYGFALAIDLSGAVVVAGSTKSTNFPTTSTAFSRTPASLDDGFLSVISPNGSKLLYSTYFGGTGYDAIHSVTLDGLGRAYITGDTYSADLPTTPGAYDPTIGGTEDAFVARLDPKLPGIVALGWGTYLGGTQRDRGYGIALGPGDEPIILGDTDSSDLPDVGSGYDSTLGGSNDLFVARLTNDGSSAPYVSYLGGPSSESVGLGSLAVDDFGRAYITCGFAEAGYPSTPDGVGVCSSDEAAFTVLDTEASGTTSMVTSGCVWDRTYGGGIAIDACRNAAITGFTSSTNYPTDGGYSTTLAGGRDAFLTQIASPSGTGNANLEVTVDDSPDPVVVGQPVTHAILVTNHGPDAAIDVRVSHQMSALVTVGSVLPLGCTAQGARVICDIGTISNGASVPLAITVTPPLPGQLWAISRAGASTDDLVCSNNSDTTVTTVADVTMHLNAPNGGTVIASGLTTSIDWTPPASAVTFDLDYSITDGAKWKAIVKGVGGNSYSWLVPAQKKGNKPLSRVRVSAFDALAKSAGTDASDAAFTIEVLKLDSPNGGENLVSGSVATIGWTTHATINPVTSVKLQYSTDGGVKWQTIATVPGNPGTYEWTVPVFTGGMPNSKVRVTLKSGKATAASDDSDAAFTMHP